VETMDLFVVLVLAILLTLKRFSFFPKKKTKNFFLKKKDDNSKKK